MGIRERIKQKREDIRVRKEGDRLRNELKLNEKLRKARASEKEFNAEQRKKAQIARKKKELAAINTRRRKRQLKPLRNIIKAASGKPTKKRRKTAPKRKR